MVEPPCSQLRGISHTRGRLESRPYKATRHVDGRGHWPLRFPALCRRDTLAEISTSAESPIKNISVTNQNRNYVAAYESHHVAYLTEFDSYEKAAAFLHGWTADVHTWPIGIYYTNDDRLWLWCGYRTLDISRESALEDARAILRLPPDHQFSTVEFMKEDL